MNLTLNDKDLKITNDSTKVESPQMMKSIDVIVSYNSQRMINSNVEIQMKDESNVYLHSILTSIKNKFGPL